MSRLFGPLSVTTRSVSERASAFAGDQIAGAGTMAPAASPDTDFRKSRRFMMKAPRREKPALEPHSQGLCQTLTEAYTPSKAMRTLENLRNSDRAARSGIAYKPTLLLKKSAEKFSSLFSGRYRSTCPGLRARTDAAADRRARRRNRVPSALPSSPSTPPPLHLRSRPT